MRSVKCVLLPVFLFLLLANNVAAQEDALRGWFFLSHQQKLSKKLDVLTDIQFRSADRFQYLTTFLFRAALSYKLNDQHAVGLGYVYKPDWLREAGQVGFQPEQRVFEQYLLNAKIKRTEITGRLRFEQRFVQEEADFRFSQRGRAFVSVQLPLIANADFSKGIYAQVQNEVFLNLVNKEVVNNSFFDQNRLQAGIGYRWSKKIDTDLNYMYWRHVEQEGYQTSHVIVLMVTTEF